MTLKTSIRKYTGAWLIWVFMFSFKVSEYLVKVFDVNKTVGWSLDLGRSWLAYLIFYLPIGLGMCYLLLDFKYEKHMNLGISIVQLIVVAICGILITLVELDLRILLSSLTVALIIFGFNLFYSYSKEDN